MTQKLSDDASINNLAKIYKKIKVVLRAVLADVYTYIYIYIFLIHNMSNLYIYIYIQQVHKFEFQILKLSSMNS